MKAPEKIKDEIKNAIKKGKLVIIHPAASKKFKGSKVKTIDFPR